MGTTSPIPPEMKKGSVYLAIANSREHPITRPLNMDGIVFFPVPQRHKRKTEFLRWVSEQPLHYRLDSSTAPQGYCLIHRDAPEDAREKSDEVKKAKRAEDTLVGVFILARASKREVGNALRERLGQGSILVRPKTGQELLLLS